MAEQTFKEGVRIYNLFPKLVGSMDNWIKHFDRIKSMHFNWIYINPFHYPGFSGSLYSPKNYYEFNPQFVNGNSDKEAIDQLKEVVEEAQKRDLYLMMDLVINHTAIDCDLTKEHPEWYVHNPDGSIRNPGAKTEDGTWITWGDLAEIDNENSSDKENLWNYWWNLVDYYCNVGFSGFRCDAAYQIPDTLWKFLISKTKDKYPQTMYFAETLGCEIEDVIKLAKSGFDYTFNSSKYWDFNEPWCLKQYNENKDYSPSISFPESHDTERLTVEVNDNVNSMKQRYAFSSIFSSGIMMPLGFEWGFRKKVNVVTTTPEDMEEINYDISSFITDCNSLKENYKIFREENEIKVINQENWMNIFCFRKTSFDGSEKALIILNKDIYNHQKVYFNSLNVIFEWEHPVIDVSPRYRISQVNPIDFEYSLIPGEVKILYSKAE